MSIEPKRCLRVCEGIGLLILLGGVPAGCDDPLVDPAVVSELRVLAVRIDNLEQPGLATLDAGQPGRSSWLLEAEQPQSFAARLVWCASDGAALGAPRCLRPPFRERTATGSSGVPLVTAFTLPDDFDPKEEWLTLLGVCPEEAPTFDWRRGTFECADGALLHAFIRNRPEHAGNQNPELDDDRLTVDGDPWLPLSSGVGEDGEVRLDAGAGLAEAGDAGAGEDVGRGDCSEGALPRVRPGERVRIDFELGTDDREALDTSTGQYAAHERESLVFTHVATSPGLERAFSALDHDAELQSFSVDFTLPRDARPPANGRVVDFTLVVRDGRGGADWQRRALCALP